MIGDFTTAVMDHVHAVHPNCRFEVLYPTDVNETPLNSVINYPVSAWTPETLDCLKTESFTFTFTRNLDAAKGTVVRGTAHGFERWQRSFLVGLMDPFTAWNKEVNVAMAENVESVVLFALDQFCLMGYPVPLKRSLRRSLFQG